MAVNLTENMTGGSVDPLDIAVVAVAGRFPDSTDLDMFWDLLMHGRGGARPIPAERWDAEEISDPEVDVPSRAHIIDGTAEFDPVFFGISPREVDHIDPQQRMLLELAWECLEDAGRPAREFRGRRVGVYVGAGWNDYDRFTTRFASTTTPHTAPGIAMDMMAERISYFLGLRGPSMVVQSGCSSSLVALHLACQALRTHEIEAALVGGAQLMFDSFASVALSHFGGLSPDGVCRAFGVGANGFVRGEGGGLLLLKRQEDAQAAGYHVRAVVKGTAVNNDGGGKSIVTPLPEGQRDVLDQAYRRFGLSVEKIGYVEAHGTGTAVGDSVEAEALGAVLGSQRPAGERIPIGSVKTNVGHLESAAGMPALVKAILSLEHGVVPPSLNSDELNPEIDFDALNLTVVHEPLPLADDALVGVSGFGWGGTNVHVVLAHGPADSDPATLCEEGRPQVLPISAHSPAALRERVTQIAGLLADGADFGAVVRSLGSHHEHLAQRLAIVSCNSSETCGLLDGWLADKANEAVFTGRAGQRGKTAFVFPGQGSQWHEMARDLLAHDTAFAESMEACAAALQPFIDWDLVSVVSGVGGEGWLDDVSQVQPALWAMAVALADSWRAHGVEPDIVIGHSQGEVAAATAAGILSLKDAARIVAVRSQLVRPLVGKGLMLAVDLTLEEATTALEGFEDDVSIAVNNGPRSCVLSGDTDMIMVLKEILEVAGTYCSLVRVDYASHSPQMDAVRQRLLAELSEITPQPGSIPMMSTVRGRHVIGTDMDAAYWFDNLREPVRFASSVESLLAEGVTHLLEVSAHPILGHSLAELVQEGCGSVLTTLRRNEGTLADLQRARARAYVAGLSPFPLEAGPAPVRVPGYPWQRTRFWKSMPETDAGARTLADPLVLTPDPTRENVWLAEVCADASRTTWLQRHRVHDAVVLPGSCMMDLGHRCHEGGGTVYRRLENVRFLDAITLSDAPTTLQVEIAHDRHDSAAVMLRSLGRGDAAWTRHFTARAHAEASHSRTELAVRSISPARQLDGAAFYADCAARGLQYGEPFQCVRSIEVAENESRAEVVATRVTDHPTWRSQAWPHPLLVDGILQSVIPLVAADTAAVPTGIETVELLSDGIFPSTVRTRAVRGEDCFHIDVMAEDGTPVMVVRGLTMAVLSGSEQGALPARWRLDFEHFNADDVKKDSPAAATVGLWDPSKRAEKIRLALGRRSIELRELDGMALDGLDHVVVVPPSAETPEKYERMLVELVEQVRCCVGVPQPPLLTLLTFDATTTSESVDPAASLVWGAGRVVRAEHPELRCRLVDATEGADPEAVATAILIARQAEVVEDQLRVTSDGLERGRYVSDDRSETAAVDLPRSDESTFRCDFVPGRSFEGVTFHPLERVAPAEGEIEIEITHAALNFIDVMKVMGIYPDQSGTRPGLGLDAAGVVSRVGEGSPFQVGDRVATAVGAGALASHVIAQAQHTQPIPGWMDSATAAALPSVMMTAWHALVDLAHVQPGEWVLVHSAAGGLGMAATGIVRYLGAQIIATAGTAEKREYLHQLGIDLVFDSRSLDWADDALAATDGKGVDVVLNSLAGAGLQRGLEILRDGGRFVEVGKRDIYGGQQIPMEVLKPGISISSLDLNRILHRRPDLFGDIFARVWDPLSEHRIDTIPVIPRSMAHAGEALAELSHGSHIGKFVLAADQERPDVIIAPFQNSRLRSDGTYLITGGLGALGLSLGQFMAERGAGHLVLVGRSAPSDQALEAMDRMCSDGATVEVRAIDVTNVQAVTELIDSLPALRGVVHAAGLLDDATISTVTPEQITRVMAPKVHGAQNLDAATRERDLDLFVTFSSAAGLFGNAGQAAYSASNCFMDSLVARRRAQGRAGLSVQWGPFTEVGLAAADSARGERLSDRGMQGFTTDEAWATLEELLTRGDVIASHVPMDVSTYFDSYPHHRGYGSFEAMGSGLGVKRGQGSNSLLATISGLAGEDRIAVIEEHVRSQAGSVLRIPAADMDPQTPFKSLGLDSLMSIELRNRLEASTDLRLSPTLIWTYGAPATLARALDDLLRQTGAVADASVSKMTGSK